VSQSVSRPPEAEQEFPVAFQTFAATLRPQYVRNAAGRVIGLAGPGAPDEIWLKHIKKLHGNEKHTPSGWKAVIDSYRDKPAHPSVLGA